MTRPALLLLAGLLIGIWAVSLLGFVFTSLQGAFGLVPRSLGHLPGVLTMPLLHQDFAHLIANSVPLAVLGALLALQGATYLRRALLVVVVLGGLLLWLFGRQGVHIGASGLVFGLFGLLLGRAWFTRSPPVAGDRPGRDVFSMAGCCGASCRAGVPCPGRVISAG